MNRRVWQISGGRGPERRFPMLDALRGMAVLAVVLLHAAQECGANANASYGMVTTQLRVGVTLFFLLSGFLLYRPYALALARFDARPSLGGYAVRRMLRIVPAYWVALTVLAVWPGLPGVFTRDAWIYYGFAQSYRNSWALAGIAPAWSLSVEVAFYTLLPLLGELLRRVATSRGPDERRSLQLRALALLGVASLALRGVGHGLGNAHLQTMIFTHFLWFALGMSVAVWSVETEVSGLQSRAARFVERNSGVCWLVAAAAYAVLCAAPIFPRAWAPGQTAWSVTTEHVLYACVALALLLPAVFGDRGNGWPRRVLASPTLRWFGLISYSLFLWHYPLLSALAARGASQWLPGWPLLSLCLVSLPPILAISWLSYAWIERPMLRWGRPE